MRIASKSIIAIIMSEIMIEFCPFCGSQGQGQDVTTTTTTSDLIQHLLKEILPVGFVYKICSFHFQPEVTNQPEVTHFKTTLRTKFTSEEEVRDWKNKFETWSLATFRCTQTFPKCGMKNVFKEYFHCQHSSLKKRLDSSKSKKNTECKATLSVIVKRCAKRSRSSDVHLPEWPTKIDISWIHNHPINSACALKYRDVSEESKEKLCCLFTKGHTPSTALDMLKSDLQLSLGDNYVFAAGDRALVPDPQFVYRLQAKQYDLSYGQSCGQDITERITEILRKFQDIQGCNSSWKLTTDGQLVVAMLSPVMKRVLCHIQQAGEMLFVDSTGNCDRHGVRVFLLLTHCSAGGVPVGCLLTTSESAETLKEAFGVYMSIVPDGAFGAQGYPSVLITDDCESLRQALKHTFPQSTLLLCTFHVLQAVWRWLWDSNHKVEKLSRPVFFSYIKAMLYAVSEEELQAHMESLVRNCSAHSKFVAYIEKLYTRRQEWALTFRKCLMVRGNNTNNYVEAAMKVFKDKVLQRTKAYNIVQLIDFVFSNLENFYVRLLTDVANGRCESRKKASLTSLTGEIPKEDIVSTDDGYSVKSQSRDAIYTVNMDLGVCTCYQGWNGGSCKHQAAVAFHFGIGSINFLPVSALEQRHFHFIATGKSVRLDWFCPLRSNTEGQQEDTVEIGYSDRNVISQEVVSEPMSVDDGDEETRDNDNTPRLTLALEKLDSFTDTVKNKLQSDPQNFLPALEAFVKSFDNTKTDSGLISALYTFGKYSGIQSTKKVVASKRIGIQPTAISRRRQKLRGKQITRAGRPTKKSAVGTIIPPEKSSKSREILRAIIPRRKAPHNLSSCVASNESLGKTHSAK